MAKSFKVGDQVNVLAVVTGIDLDGNGGVTIELKSNGQRITFSKYSIDNNAIERR